MSHSIIPSSDADYLPPGPPEEYAAPRPPAGARRAVFFLRKFWWLPLLMMVLALGTAAAYVRYLMPPHFVSVASMWEPEKLRLPEGGVFTDDAQDYTGTQMELLRNELDPRVLERLQAAGSNGVPLDKDGKPFQVEVTVRQAPKSTILRIEAVTANPAYAQAYLDALLTEYVEYKKYVRGSVSTNTLDSIRLELEEKEKELNKAQEALTSFERTNNLTILQEEASIFGGYLAKLQTELSDLKLESQLLDATAAQQDLAGRTNAFPDFARGLRDSVSASAPPASPDNLSPFQEIELLKSEREKLSQNLRPEHPKIVKLDAQIARDEEIIKMFHDVDREEFAASRQNLKTKIENVVASTNEWEGKITEANHRIAEADILKLNVNRAQSMYERLNQILQTVDISRHIDQESLAILASASPPKRTYSDEIRLLLVSGMGGLAGGFCLVAFIGFRDDRFNSLADVNDKFGDVIVGQVPEMPVIGGKTGMPLLEAEDRRDMYAESYRSLRSAILFMQRNGERPKILLITSALANEGKSTVAANLARTLALGGSRVLLVDADLRRGYLHNLLGMRLAPGLADLLERPNDLDAIIQSDSLPNFAFLSRGKSVPNPGDLFLSSKLDHLFARLREKYDYVLIDSSPVFAADDAASLAPKADGTLFVVRNRFSPAGAVKEALELLGQRQVRVLGLVFNRADASSRSYYYYKNADYYRPNKTA